MPSDSHRNRTKENTAKSIYWSPAKAVEIDMPNEFAMIAVRYGAPTLYPNGDPTKIPGEAAIFV
jgi:hypothetical protein